MGTGARFVRAASAAAVLWVSAAAAGAPAPGAIDSATSAEERLAFWREDLAQAAEIISDRHVNPFTEISREKFQAAVDAASKELEGKSDQQAALILRRVAALIGDGHTSVYDSRSRFAQNTFPVGLLPLKDGVFVAAFPSDQPELARAQVIRIGDTPIDEVMKRLGIFVSHETESALINSVRSLASNGDALVLAGVISDPGKAAFTLKLRDGSERVVELTRAQPGTKLATAFTDPAALGISRRQQRPPMGSEMLPGGHDLYVWYDTCADQPSKSVADFCKEALSVIEKEKPDRVVIDLRRNGGGNSALLQPLVQGLAANPALAREGGVKVLIGRSTFSSAVMNAADFKQKLKAQLVGLPTGGSLNGFGEVKSVTLPHSGLVVQYSTKRFTLDNTGIHSLMPDQLVEPASDDFFGTDDRILGAALARDGR